MVLILFLRPVELRTCLPISSFNVKNRILYGVVCIRVWEGGIPEFFLQKRDEMDVKLRFLLELRSSSRIARKSEMDAPPTVRAPDLWSSYYLLLSTLSVSSGIFLHLFEKEYNQDELSELTRFISFCKKKKKPFQEQRLQPLLLEQDRQLLCQQRPKYVRNKASFCPNSISIRNSWNRLPLSLSNSHLPFVLREN